MVKLRCVVVGDGRFFEVEIDLDKSVEGLKKLILDELPDFTHYGSAARKLFVAYNSDGEWLKRTDADVRGMKTRRVPETIEAAMSGRPLVGFDPPER